MLSILLHVAPYLVVIGPVVVIHEFGHFLAGKAVGAKIDQFSIGFGKPILQRTDRSGVQWRLGWLPIGGYVRFAGDDNAASVPDTDDLDALRRDVVAREGEKALQQYHYFKPIWQRAIISAAGPIANFVLSIAIFAGLLMALGEPISPARVGAVFPNTPAARSGMQAGDLIVAADGKPVKSFDTVRELVVLRTGVPITFVVERAGRQVALNVIPVRGQVADAVGHYHQLGTIGVRFESRPEDQKLIRYGPVEALRKGTAKTYDVIQTTIYYVGRMIAGKESADQLSGPVGMAQFSGDLVKQVADSSPDARTLAINVALMVLQLVANISVGIGFLNLMPIPVLDGGHLLFYAYEAVARRPLAAKVQAAGYRVGLALVLGLMLFATWNDLQRLRVFNFLGGLFS
ncbi:RIP metalloprotease [Phenylobacterium sp.]|jgi:regulator of sigma E protease|uniref:M50 family metallopeptidase n=1 Tax=Phenylobacterium sp. TaxID=1871053 RepID=UPI002F3EB7EF